MRVIAGFHTRDDEWVLQTKLEVCSRFCDAIVVCLDRASRATREILRRFPKVDAFEHKNTMGLPDADPTRGPLCEEGAMRQEVFDACAEHRPDLLYLGDTDEIPTPDVIPWLASLESSEHLKQIDVFKLHIVNLYKEGLYISGKRCIWSLEHRDSNKRAAFIRYDPRKTYTYDISKPCHVPLDPSITGGSGVPVKRTHMIDAPKILHLKWTNWERWLASYKAGMGKYQAYWDGLETSPVPKEWQW